MEKGNKSPRKRIFGILIIVSIVIGFIIYGAMREQFGLSFLVFSLVYLSYCLRQELLACYGPK